MFTRRTSLVPVGIISEPENKKFVFASDETPDPVSFDYDPDNFVYFRCRAITADESNGNGDFFPEAEIKKAYKSFIGVGLYKDHQSDSVDKSIGKVLWAEWVPSGKYVECYCAVDKKLAPDLAHRVQVGIATSVSMGCSVQEAECSICGRVAHNANELCEHMMPGFGMKGRRDAKGNIVYEINRGLQFNELSLVTVPADPTARIFEIYASLKRKAAAENLEELKKLYVFSFLPSAYDGKAQQASAAEIQSIVSSLSPEDIKNFRLWVAQNDISSGNIGQISDVSVPLYQLEGEAGVRSMDDDPGFNYAAPATETARPMWTLAAAHMGPEHRKVVDSYRYMNLGRFGDEKKAIARNYFNAIDSVMEAQRKAIDELNSKNLSPEEQEKGYEEIATKLAPLWDNVDRAFNDVTKAGGLLGRLQKSYETYALYSNYFDVAQGESENMPPLEEVTEEIKSGKHPGLQVARFKQMWDRLSKAWSTVSSESLEKEYNDMASVANPDKVIPEGGINDEAIRNMLGMPEKKDDVKPMEEMVSKIPEAKKEIEEKTKDLSEEPLAGAQRAVEKKQKEKEKKEQKKLPEVPELEQPAPVPPAASPSEKKEEEAPVPVGAKPRDVKPESEEEEEQERASSLTQDNKVVIKIDKSLEDVMSLVIAYNKGSSLNTSYFEAKQGSLAYRVAAAEVLPIPVQEAIKQNDPRVATPEQIISDLTAKYSSIEGFKAWAKKRKKKNKKALLKLMPKNSEEKKQETAKSEVEVKAADEGNGRINEMKENAIPKSAGQETPQAAPVPETPQEETKVEAQAEATVDAKSTIQAALASLAKFVESKLSTTAVKTEKVEAKVDGVAKSSPAPEPKGAINEISKTENPKGFVDKAALKAQAMDENWTVNQKELEKEPKQEFGDHPLPPDFSVEEKEVNKEAVKVSNSSEHAGKVKKYFGKLGPGAEGEPELAMDLKSSQAPEVKLLREALAKEQAEKEALLEKQRLQAVADKIYNIVATLKGKNLVKTAAENAVIDALTQNFTDEKSLDGLTQLVETLADNPAEATLEMPGEPEQQVVPQVFETPQQSAQEDPVETMSRIWDQ